MQESNMKELWSMQEQINNAREKHTFDWHYFSIREILPKFGFYAIGARLEFDGSITYISCDKEGSIDSIKIVSVK